MSENTLLPRSPELMSPGDTTLLVVDVQEKLVPLIDGHRRAVWNIGRLLDAAALLGVHVAATEQYPKGLGATVPALAEKLEHRTEKLSFSCGGCTEFVESLRQRPDDRLLVVGIETHVCVQQTVLDLMADGRRVLVAVDGVGSRKALDHETALRRMDSAGATLTTTEAVLFEWCQTAASPEFKQISRLVREEEPAST